MLSVSQLGASMHSIRDHPNQMYGAHHLHRFQYPQTGALVAQVELPVPGCAHGRGSVAISAAGDVVTIFVTPSREAGAEGDHRSSAGEVSAGEGVWPLMLGDTHLR